MRHEAKLGDVIDPLAGSYYVESLTDQVEAETLQIMDRIEEMGGSVEAIKSATTEQLLAVKGITPKLVEVIQKALSKP